MSFGSAKVTYTQYCRQRQEFPRNTTVFQIEARRKIADKDRSLAKGTNAQQQNGDQTLFGELVELVA